VVGRDDQSAALDPGVLTAAAREPEVDEEERLQDDTREQVEEPVDPVLARVLVVAEKALLGHT
jgi:hypothetical protein